MPPSTSRAPPLERALDDVVDALDLLLVDDRPELDVLAVRVAGAQPARLLGEQIDVLVGDRAMDDVAAGGEAHLALELEAGVGAGACGGGRSASSSTISGLLPPSSRLTFLSRPPACAPTIRPTSVEPVNETMLMFGSVTSASPVSASPMTIWSSPSGRPASLKTAANMAPPQIGVCGSGLSTTALPSASAGATTRMPSTLGEFHGVIAPTTPTGTRRIIDSRSCWTVGTSEPYGCHGIAAAASSSPAAKFCSWCILLRWAPVSRCVHVPNSGRCAS